MMSRELERAKHIHECLAKVSPGDLKKYSVRLKGAPAEVMENGLLQTLAFYRHKRGEHDLIANDLTAWLRKLNLLPDQGLESLAQLPATRYRQCSEEAIAWLNWAKRLALAKVAKEGADGSRGSR